MEIDNYQLSSYFLNQKLFLSSLSSDLVNDYETKVLATNMYDGHYKKILIDKHSMDLTVEHIQRNEIPVLEKLIISNDFKNDSLFYSDYTFNFRSTKRVSSYDKPFQKEFNLDLPQYNIKLEGSYNTSHYTCNTAFTNLSRKYRCFLYGKIESFNATKRILTIRPIIFAEKFIKSKDNRGHQPFRAYMIEKNRLNIEDIDEFKKVKRFSKKVDFSILASIPEKEIKRMFAEIIYENNIPKDWGGETSDLYTYNLHIGKKRIRTAFAFKGPAKNKVLEIKDLGKNGDQIVRLFHETADVYILQHCNYIKPTVETTMDAFSTQHLRSRKYVIINGEDTYKILRSYNKI